MYLESKFYFNNKNQYIFDNNFLLFNELFKYLQLFTTIAIANCFTEEMYNGLIYHFHCVNEIKVFHEREHFFCCNWNGQAKISNYNLCFSVYKIMR